MSRKGVEDVGAIDDPAGCGRELEPSGCERDVSCCASAKAITRPYCKRKSDDDVPTLLSRRYVRANSGMGGWCGRFAWGLAPPGLTSPADPSICKGELRRNSFLWEKEFCAFLAGGGGGLGVIFATEI